MTPRLYMCMPMYASYLQCKNENGKKARDGENTDALKRLP